MLKRISLLVLLSVQLSFAQSILLTTLDGGVSYEPETLAFQTRVKADGGEVIDLDAVNDFYVNAKANNYLDTLICALLYTGGVKKSHDSVSVWYDLTDNENDFKTLNGLVTNTSPLYNITNGIGNNTQPQLQAVMTYSQPSAYYVIGKRSGYSGYEYFWASTASQGLLQDGATDHFYVYAGNDFIASIGYTNNTFQLWRIIYSGATSSVQVNNGTAVTGNAGTQGLSNTTFTIFNTNTNTSFKCFIITPRLSTTKDTALKTILNTIYPTY